MKYSYFDIGLSSQPCPEHYRNISDFCTSSPVAIVTFDTEWRDHVADKFYKTHSHISTLGWLHNIHQCKSLETLSFRTETILRLRRLTKESYESHETFPRYGISSDLDSEVLQVLVGLNILLDSLFDHISGLLAVFLNPVGIELLVGLRGPLLH